VPGLIVGLVIAAVTGFLIVFCAISSRKRSNSSPKAFTQHTQNEPVENRAYSEAATPLLGGEEASPDTWLYFKKADCGGFCSSASVGRSVVAGFLLLKNGIFLILFGLLHHELKAATGDVTLS
jgi:hypothetical protein